MRKRYSIGVFAVLAVIASLTIAAAVEKEEAEEQEVKVALDQVPAAVKAALEAEAKGGKIVDVGKITEDGKTVYEAEIQVGGKESDVTVAEDGKVVSRESEEKESVEKGGKKEKDDDEKDEKSEKGEDEEKDEQEIKVTLDQVPAAVKAALETESKGGKINEIEKKTEEGKTVYEAEVAIGDKETDVQVGEDGKVLQREEQGKEDEEKEEKDEAQGGAEYVKVFNEDKADLESTGQNDYWVLEPGYVLTLKSKDGNKELIITVLDETKDVDGVKTRVIEERESEGGKVTEISRNYYVISKKTKNVYYFGEESKEFEDGKVKSTEGSWESGKNGAQFGLMMPAKPKVGERYYQEIAEKDKAMDRAETVSLTEKVTVPAGTFESCLKTKESSPVEGGTEAKLYAPGIGLLIDGDMQLVKYGPGRK